MSNILPQKEISKIARLYRKRFLVIAFTAVTLLAAVGCAMLIPTLYYARQNELVLQAKKDQLDQLETGSYRQSLADSISDINSRLEVFGQVPAISPVIGSVVNVVLSAKTPNIHIEEIQSGTDSKDPTLADVTVTGFADTREALLYFADTLRGNAGVTGVNVPIDTYIKNTDVPFTMTATFDLH